MSVSNPQHQRYERITRAFLDDVWCILPSKLEAIAEFLQLRLQGGILTDAEIAAVVAAAPPSGDIQRQGAVAVLPVLGTLRNRANLIAEASGGTSVQMLTQEFRVFVADPNVSAIVLDIDSPGGAIDGIPELAAEIFAARSVKPIVAVANTMAASAAFWLAAAATEIVAQPSAQVGSIGTFMVHEDVSAKAEQEGVKVTLISAGKHKTEGNPFEPLDDETHAVIQARVDEAFADFTGAIAQFRGVSLADVQGERFGEGRLLSARTALAQGVIDRVETLDQTVARLLKPQESGALMRQAAPETLATESNLDVLAERLAPRIADRINSLTPAAPTPEPDSDEPLRDFDVIAVAEALAEQMKEQSSG